ncbi:hypothetical protein N9Z68_04700 [Akkermansiaceae bacterium]|nr:hypothetical protein [Akkermansiaceae bacterium]
MIVKVAMILQERPFKALLTLDIFDVFFTFHWRKVGILTKNNDHVYHWGDLNLRDLDES